jgi:hypothetical protein
MSKAISRFEPTPSRTPEECERHYTSVHVRMAQDLLRPMPGLRSYHVNRAQAQADVGGGWAQRPRAWRFALVRFSPDAVLDFSPAQAETVAQDHVNCLYRLRHCSLEETILLDRRGEQLTLAKFMIEADRAADVSAEFAWDAFEGLASHIRELMAHAFGARLLILNRALDEVACEPLDVEGQRPVGLLAETLRVGYVEAYFDHRRWGEEALGGLAKDGSLRDPALTDVNLLRLEELAALELR